MRGHGVDAPLTAGGRAWGRSDQRCGQKGAAAGGQLLQGPSSDGGATQQQQHAGTKRQRWSLATQLIAGGALLVGLLLLMVLVAAGAEKRRTTPGGAAATAAPLAGGGSYLRQIAAVHDHQHQQQLKAVNGGAALLFDLQSTLQHCASQLAVPADACSTAWLGCPQLPQHIPGPAWHPPPSSSRWPDDALQQLSLDCSSPAHAAGCAEASGSNLYEEGSLPALDPRDLALLLQDFNTPAAAAAASGGVLDDALQQLSLDCERQPAACAAVADASNAYEEGPDAVRTSNRLAAAEAAAFFTSSEAASRSAGSWDALLGAHGLTEGGEQQQEELAAAHATNLYEGVQASSWQYRRQAEEAAAHYLDVSTLDLDCSEAAVQRDAHAHAECRRSRAVNRYEAGAADASAAAAAAAAAEEDEHDEHTQEAVTAGAAVLPPQRSSSSSSSSLSSSAEARRLYFKNPCNSPLVRRQFKNRSNHPMHRLHFKNQANAPASLAALLAPSPLSPAPRAAPVAAPATAAAPAAARRQGTGVWPAGVLVAVAVLLCSACCSKLLGWPASAAGKHQPVQQQQPAEQQLRKGSRSWSCLLVPWGSQELPTTPQRTVEEPLPVLGALAGCGLAGPAPASSEALAGGSSYGERPVLPTAAGTPFALAAANLLPPGALADGRDVAAAPASVGGLVREQHQQQQDVVQDGRDSPRPPMHGPFSRGATPLPHSRAGTPLPATCKGD